MISVKLGTRAEYFSYSFWWYAQRSRTAWVSLGSTLLINSGESVRQREERESLTLPACPLPLLP